VLVAIEDGEGDAHELLLEVQRVRGDGKPLFPLLRGPKIRTVWVRILAFPGAARISSLETLPVAVDVQVRKITEYLGLTATRGLEFNTARDAVQRVWAEDVRAHGAEGPPGLEDTNSALDPALWFWAKWGCTRCERANMRLPISPICDLCQFDRLWPG
jgi:hypothetical protein